jgi:hypothetical protein
MLSVVEAVVRKFEKCEVTNAEEGASTEKPRAD